MLTANGGNKINAVFKDFTRDNIPNHSLRVTGEL